MSNPKKKTKETILKDKNALGRRQLKMLCKTCNPKTAIYILRIAKSKGFYDVIEYARINSSDKTVRQTAERYINNFLKKMQRNLASLKAGIERMEFGESGANRTKA